MSVLLVAGKYTAGLGRGLRLVLIPAFIYDIECERLLQLELSSCSVSLEHVAQYGPGAWLDNTHKTTWTPLNTELH